MSSELTPTELISRVRASGVVPEEILSEFLAALGHPPGDLPADLLPRLLDAGLVTTFQANQLTAGRTKGFRIGNYIIREKLGAGGMGQVFLAQHATLPKQVAVKVLPPEFKSDPIALARFVREAKTCASISHPNIVGVYDVHGDANPPYIIMEYVDGISLQGAVADFGPLSPGEAAHCGYHSAIGLQRAFEAQLVHRDIKPPNILVSRAGVVKILDFGIARIKSGLDEDDGLTMTGGEKNKAILGTADYLAPEQAVDSSGVDTRADLYALGATLYYLLAGHPPFPEKSTTAKLLRKQVADPRPIHTLRPDVHPGLSAVIQKLLARTPEGRYQTPAEAAAALAPFAHPGLDFPGRLFGEVRTGSSSIAPPEERPTVASSAAMPRSDYYAVPIPDSGLTATPYSGRMSTGMGSLPGMPSGFVAQPIDPAQSWIGPGGFHPGSVDLPPGSFPVPGSVDLPPGALETAAPSGRIDYRPPGITLGPNGTVVAMTGAEPTVIDDGWASSPPSSKSGVRREAEPDGGGGKGLLYVGVGLAVAVLALALVAMYLLSRGTDPVVEPPATQPSPTFVKPIGKTTLIVARAGPGVRSVREALQKAKPGDRIEIRDDNWDEPFEFAAGGSYPPDLTIVGAIGLTKSRVTWKPPANHPNDQPWFRVNSGNGIKFENFNFDGENRVKFGIHASGSQYSFVDCWFRRFQDVSVLLLDARAEGKGGAVFDRCRFVQENDPGNGWATGIQFGTGDGTCDGVVVRDCRFEGQHQAAIRFVAPTVRATIERNRFYRSKNAFLSAKAEPARPLNANVFHNAFCDVQTGFKFETAPTNPQDGPIAISGNLFDNTKTICQTDGAQIAPKDWPGGTIWDRPIDPKVGVPQGDVRRFRLSFDLPADAPLPAATLNLNAPELMVWVNGTAVISDWFAPEIYVDSRDISKQLRTGKNSIAVAVRSRTGTLNRCGLVGELRAMRGNEPLVLRTGPDWKVAADEPANWTSPDFDDGGWAKATVAEQGGKPFVPPYLVWLVDVPTFLPWQSSRISLGTEPNATAQRMGEQYNGKDNGSATPRELGPILQPVYAPLKTPLSKDAADDRIFLRIADKDLPESLRGKVGVRMP